MIKGRVSFTRDDKYDTYEIVKHLTTIDYRDDGMNRELNLVSWNGLEPRYDIRRWNESHTQMTRGVTLTRREMECLIENIFCEALDKHYSKQ